MSKTAIVYHSYDHDGQFGGAILKIAHPDAKMFPLDHTQKDEYSNICEKLYDYDTVYITDFSFTPELMSELNERTNLIWIDHHITAINDIDTSIKGIRDASSSGIQLTYKWCNENISNFPKLNKHLIDILGDYDRWSFDFKDPDCEHYLINAGLKSMNTNPSLIKGLSTCITLLQDDHKSLYAESLTIGKGIVESLKSHYKNIFKMSERVYINGINILIVNASGMNSSAYHFAGIKDETEAICCWHRYAKDKYKASFFSVTNNPDIDLSTIAKKYGGGGHKGACGFIGSLENIMELYENPA